MNTQAEADKVLERMRLAEVAEKHAIDSLNLSESIKAALYARPRVLPAGVTREPILAKALPVNESAASLCVLLERIDRMDAQIIHKVQEWGRNDSPVSNWVRWIKNARLADGLGLHKRTVGELNRRIFEYYKVYLNQIIIEGVKAGTYIHFERNYIKGY